MDEGEVFVELVGRVWYDIVFSAVEEVTIHKVVLSSRPRKM